MTAILNPSPDQTVDPPTRERNNQPPRILVVEDDGGIRRLSAGLLLRSGYHVDAAEDGAVAWDALCANSYHLLITDHQMPKVSGVQLVERLRSARMPTRVILVSGALPTEELGRKPWLQLDGTLDKPFVPEQLLRTVKEVLQGADLKNVHDEMRPQLLS